MSHPCVVTLDRNSKPRVLFAGDRLVEVKLPAGTRCIYPKPPLPALSDVGAALREAIERPASGAPLAAQLTPGMKVTIALADISTPAPPMRAPDPRAVALGVLLPLLREHGVDDVEIIIAGGLQRRMRDSEIAHLAGPEVFERYRPARLYHHDPEAPGGLIELGKTELGEVVELNRRAAESDLLVFVNVTVTPLPAAPDSVALALGGYRSFEICYGPRALCEAPSKGAPSPPGFSSAVARLERVIAARLDVFAIEITLNNRLFDRSLEWLTKNEDELTPREVALLRTLVISSAKLPPVARQAVFSYLPAAYGVTGVFAGEPRTARKQALERCYEQQCVPVTGQADVLVTGIPHFSPHNVHSVLNPLLAQLMAEGYLVNLYRGAPLVRRGGTLILTHPCTDKFDHKEHAAHRELVHRLLPETRDAEELERRYQGKLIRDPALLEMFRRGHAHHPAHPFFVRYLTEAGRRHLGRVIVVGADNEYVPRLLGYETAVTIEEALYRARGDSTRSLQIACLHSPPLLVADVTPLEVDRRDEGAAA